MLRQILFCLLFAIPCHATLVFPLNEPHWALPLQLSFSETLSDDQISEITELVQSIIAKIEAIPLRQNFFFKWTADRSVLQNKEYHLVFTYKGGEEYREFYEDEGDHDEPHSTSGWPDENGNLHVVTLVTLDHYIHDEVTPEFKAALTSLLVKAIYGYVQGALEFKPGQVASYDPDTVQHLQKQFNENLFFNPVSKDFDFKTQHLLFFPTAGHCSGVLQ